MKTNSEIVKSDKESLPIKLYIAASIFTTFIMLIFSWYTWKSYDDFKTIKEQYLRLEELCGTITYLDEVLTMSARMAVSSGDLKWEERYLKYEPQLDSVIKEAKLIAPEIYISEAANQTDIANLKLVVMEKESFRLLHEGKRDSAGLLLFSPQYEDEKKVYKESNDIILAGLRNKTTSVLISHHRAGLIAVVCVIISLPVLLFVWIGTGKKMKNNLAEHKLAEDKLKASETRYRRLFESAKDGILILDFETGLIVDVNPYLVEILGYLCEYFLGKKLWEIGFFKDIASSKDSFTELQNKGYIRYDDLPLETAKGQRVNVEFVSNVYTVNHTKVIQCNIRNITERRRIEVMIRESEAQFRSLAEQSPNMIFINKNGKVVFVNKKCEEIMGYTREEFLSPSFDFRSIIASESQGLIQEAFSKHQQGEEVPSYEYSLITRKGENITAIISSKLISYFGENAILGVITDITALRQAEQEREKLIQELQDSIAKIKTLSGLLPICASCKKIRDDKGYWQQVEEYIGERSEAQFTHGICPQCTEKFFPVFL